MPVTIKSRRDEKWAIIDLPYPTKAFDYLISNYGRIISRDRVTQDERLLKTGYLRGYERLSVSGADRRKSNGLYIHKLVADYFVPKPDDKTYYVHHIDGDRSNNRHTNITWIPYEVWKAKVDKSKREKTNYRDPSRKNIKLTEAKVALIKRYLLEGKTRKKMIAKRFGITHTQLNRIASGENWGDVKALE